jgi:hypothetical protein
MGRIEVFLTPHGAGLTDAARPGEVCFCRVISKPICPFFGRAGQRFVRGNLILYAA